MNESTVRRALDEIGYKRHLIPLDIEERFLFEVDTPITIYDQSVMVTADWHIPIYDPVYVNRMIEHARRDNIETLVVGGDFFNFDSLSRFDGKQADAGLERELEEGISIMSVLCETFEEIFYIWGNHDARMHTALGQKLKFKQTLQMIFSALDTEQYARLTFSDLDHLWVVQDGSPNGDPWYICHPASYNRQALTTAKQLSAIHGANVITAHSHHCAVGYAVNGFNVVADAGGLFDFDKTAYLRRSTTHPRWTQGYSWLKDGKLGVSSPGWSLV